MKQGDALSQETQYAGIPKACKLRRNGAHNLSPGSTQIQFDATDYNYGPFVITLGAVANVQVSEPGIYDLMAQASVSAAAATQYYAVISINGVQTVFASIVISPTAGNYWRVHEPLELKAGDQVSLVITNLTGAANTAVAGLTWLYVEKKGGRYGI